MCLNYNELDDEQLIELIHDNDADAMEYMLKKHGSIVKKETRAVYIIGAEAEDLAQEGMIGLFKAIRDYEPGKGAMFSTFATLCIRRQLQTAINNSNRKKHSPLNTYISIYDEVGENGMQLFADMEDCKDGVNPEEVVIKREQMGALASMIKTKLSKYEREVINLYLDGLPYSEIADRLGKSPKSIDNALQRIRAKISLT